jgi:hypothetical protein
MSSSFVEAGARNIEPRAHLNDLRAAPSTKTGGSEYSSSINPYFDTAAAPSRSASIFRRNSASMRSSRVLHSCSLRLARLPFVKWRFSPEGSRVSFYSVRRVLVLKSNHPTIGAIGCDVSIVNLMAFQYSGERFFFERAGNNFGRALVALFMVIRIPIDMPSIIFFSGHDIHRWSNRSSEDPDYVSASF